MTRAIVCGGRSYGTVPHHTDRWDREEARLKAKWERLRFVQIMDAAVERLAIDAIASGMAQGADALALKWAKRRGVPFTGYRAEWQTLGKAAGPIRNGRMIAEFAPDMVIAFPGGSGTADCCRQADVAGVRVIKVDW